MVFVYDSLFILFSFLYLPYLLLKRKWHSKFWMRFGFFKKEDLGLADKKRIWIHAVSVGEVMAIRGLIKKIKVRYPYHQVIVSVVTQTGFQVARTIIDKDDVVMYAPLDLSFAVRKYIDVIQPAIYLNAETEFWPNILTALHRRGVPIVQINGRISDRAFPGYKFFKGLFQKVLSYIDCFCMQSEPDADRIKELGADAKKVYVAGNMKFDDIPSPDVQGLPKALTSKEEMVLIAGSTHPGEEEIILDIARNIGPEIPSLRLILAPRHPERTEEIVSLCKQKGFKAIRFSQLNDMLSEEVIVVDTIGHLRSLFHLGKVVFLGKSLTAKGGHNIIEPACYGKPIVVGPFMENFRDVTRIFLDNDALIQVTDKEELKMIIVELFEDRTLREKFGNNAKETIEKHRGATEKTLNIISKFVN